jgi:hypothetical protein
MKINRFSMATPRPLGVRRADDNEEQIVKRVTSCTHGALFIGYFESLLLGFWVGLGFSSLALASPTLPSPANPKSPEYRVCLFGLGQRRMQGPLRAILFAESWPLQHARASGHGRELFNRKKHQ